MYKIHILGLTGMNYGNANTMEIDETGESKAIDYIKHKLSTQKKKIVIFDVGANVGDYSLEIQKKFDSLDLQIFAFEPSQGTYEQLAANTEHLNNIQLLHFALGSKEENTKIYYHFQASGATTLYNQGLSTFSSENSIAEDISIRTIEQFCEEASVDFIDFIKIDVEGHELQVLLGAKQLLQSKKIRFIQFEFGAFHVHSRTFFKDFWDLLSENYHVYRIIADGLYRIESYNENLEIFRTSNFVAELKK